MSNSYKNIIQPLNKEVEQIREELFEREVHQSGDERVLYGVSEEAFKWFKLENTRNGSKVDKKVFYEAKIEQLEKIQTAVKGIEEKYRKDGHELILQSVYFSIHSAIDIAEQKIELIDNPVTPPQPSNENFITIPVDSGVEHIKLDYGEKDKPRKRNLKTYTLLLKPPMDNEMFKILKDLDLISKNTTFKDFKFIFLETYISDRKYLKMASW